MVFIKNIRLGKYDYGSAGYYFVTVVTHYRKNFFKGNEGEVKEQLSDLVRKTEGLALDFYVVMPNHLHIIFVLNNCKLKLGEIVRRFKAKVTHTFGKKLWQPNYYEHVIRNEKALNKIREYILRNSAEEIIEFKQFYE